ncbi:hypothetical protein [Shewanella sp. NIFS-20-20]|uniref:hypothetical protein n=1 Tax=Shewanella sp. NIFS-20-20 TaxID=2853806 RepID=UPI001C47A673|nr:hypothetical protein [Shewanella sp. NIFS-20-20]MBV7317482.1 hypothetical protein [Shewanella sp. NIFS-20-20]
MPANESPLQKRRRRAISSGVTSYPADFAIMCRKKPHRIGIIAKGDSWFAYPRKWIAFGGDSNIVFHLENKLAHTDSANLLRLAVNGDEAVAMTSGKQFQQLYKILKINQSNIDFIMFSGGGNDIVGKHDMLSLLNPYQSGFDHLACIHHPRFEQKLDAIILAYQRLIALCEDFAPEAKIITHTYDIAKPWAQGAEFFWGLIKTEPWIYPYLIKRNIPERLHLPIIKYMLNQLAERLLALAAKPSTQGRLVVINTQGTLRPGSQEDWLNEIHPSVSGFNQIFLAIYPVMQQLQPQLP